jgi:hypothetical protein
MPAINTEIRQEVLTAIDELIEKQPELVAAGEKRKAEASDLLDRFAHDPPKEVWYHGIRPETAPNAADAVSSMVWRFCCIAANGIFSTCDNPVVFFENEGPKKQEGRAMLPCNEQNCLVGNMVYRFAEWIPPRQQEYRQRTKSPNSSE